MLKLSIIEGEKTSEHFPQLSKAMHICDMIKPWSGGMWFRVFVDGTIPHKRLNSKNKTLFFLKE